MPPSGSHPSRELLLDSDPSLVSDWSRDRAVAGAVYVAPSAAARRLALQCLADERDTTLGLTIVSPGRLLPLLESRAGLPAPNTLSSALEQMLVTTAARDAHVPLFDDAEHAPPAGAVRAVARLIRTLRNNRITPDVFRAAGGDPRAADAYARFETRRRELGFHDDVDRVDALLAAGIPAFPLVLEEPFVAHRVAWDLYQVAIRASTSCHIAVADLADDESLSRWPARLEPLGFHLTYVLKDPCLPREVPSRAIGGVGMHDEVELVAREMLALLRSDGTLHPTAILGVAPNATYLSLLADACARLGIPVASPRNAAAADVPLVRALLDTFRLLADPDEDTAERGLALLGTPYVGLSLAAHDRFARVLVRRGLGALRSWHRFAASTGKPRFVKFAVHVARLAKRLQGERAPKELSAALTSLGLEWGFLSAGRRANLASGRDDALRLDQKGWDCITAAADELNDALRVMGTTRISARRWLAELSAVIADSQVRVDAKAYEGVHLTIAGAGLPIAAHVFAVGWHEGLFPRRTREDPLLPERVKRALNEQGAMIPLAADRTAREHERRERIRCAASESLVVSWPATGDGGEPNLPSFYMDDLGVAQREPRSVGDTTWPLPLAASRGEQLTRATLVARHRTVDSAQRELGAVRDALSSLDDGERRAYDGLLHAKQVIRLPKEIAAESGTLAGHMSASQAKLIAHCLYQHFGTKRLGLQALVAPPADERVLGTVAHKVLNELGRIGFDPAALDETFERSWRAVVPRELFEDPETTFELEMLHANLTELVAQEHQHFAAGPVRPTYFELAFGSHEDGHDPFSREEGLDVPLPAGLPIAVSTLRGSIDRVDVIERDGRRYGVAIDYKKGKGEYNAKEMEEMADFQLPIYCEVLPLFGIEPVGAVYLGISGGQRHGVIRSDFADLFVPAGSAGKLTKLEPAAFEGFMAVRRAALRVEIARVARGELVTRARNDDCDYCELRPLCRIGTFGVGGIPVEG